MFYVDRKGTYSKYQPPNGDYRILPLNLQISYYKKDIGIKWLIHHNTWSDRFRSYTVEAIINPKILGGISDYITAATLDDMDTAIAGFNLEAKRISTLLKTFDCYCLKRVDYCLNFYLDELIPGCNPNLIMNLIKRGDIPHNYEEWGEYDNVSHRKKSSPNSFYLISKSVNINCYNKYMQLLERSKENANNGYPPISQAVLGAAQGIIRFEVQCKHHKMNPSSNSVKGSENDSYNKYKDLLSYETCIDTIIYYYRKIIKYGDWYTLQDAVRKIMSQHYNRQKEKRLIDVLGLVNQRRSFNDAKTAYTGEKLKAFKRTIKDLISLNINPVTIPREWGIKHIPNLLNAYFDKVQEEQDLKETERFRDECLKEILANKKERARLFSSH